MRKIILLVLVMVLLLAAATAAAADINTEIKVTDTGKFVGALEQGEYRQSLRHEQIARAKIIYPEQMYVGQAVGLDLHVWSSDGVKNSVTVKVPDGTEIIPLFAAIDLSSETDGNKLSPGSMDMVRQFKFFDPGILVDDGRIDVSIEGNIQGRYAYFALVPGEGESWVEISTSLYDGTAETKRIELNVLAGQGGWEYSIEPEEFGIFLVARDEDELAARAALEGLEYAYVVYESSGDISLSKAGRFDLPRDSSQVMTIAGWTEKIPTGRIITTVHCGPMMAGSTSANIGFGWPGIVVPKLSFSNIVPGVPDPKPVFPWMMVAAVVSGIVTAGMIFKANSKIVRVYCKGNLIAELKAVKQDNRLAVDLNGLLSGPDVLELIWHRFSGTLKRVVIADEVIGEGIGKRTKVFITSDGDKVVNWF